MRAPRLKTQRPTQLAISTQGCRLAHQPYSRANNVTQESDEPGCKSQHSFSAAESSLGPVTQPLCTQQFSICKMGIAVSLLVQSEQSHPPNMPESIPCSTCTALYPGVCWFIGLFRCPEGLYKKVLGQLFPQQENISFLQELVLRWLLVDAW